MAKVYLPKRICLQRRVTGKKNTWTEPAYYSLRKITDWSKWTIHTLNHDSYGIGLHYERVPAKGDFWDSLELARGLTLEEAKLNMSIILGKYADPKDFRLYVPKAQDRSSDG